MNNNVQQQQEMTMMTNRDVHWSAVAVGSTVALVSLITDMDGNLSDQNRQHKWAASAISVSFSLAWIAVFANILLRTKFIGTLLEGITIIFVTGFWAAVMPVLMDPASAVSVTGPVGGIKNANLYFFTWFSLVMSFMTLVHFMKDRYATNSHFAFTSWGALMMTSIIVSVSAGRLFRFLACSQQDVVDLLALEDICNRTSFAASIGSICGALSAIWMIFDLYWSNKIKNMIEVVLGLTMFVLWIFGVGYITFGGDDGPATQVGNLYFFTWGSFGFSLLVFIHAVQGYRDSRMMTSDPAIAATDSDAPVGGDEKKISSEDNIIDDGEASA